jgi:hypothetical protein
LKRRPIPSQRWRRFPCGLTLALPGTQPVPRSGSLRLRVRAEQPVNQHGEYFGGMSHGLPE